MKGYPSWFSVRFLTSFFLILFLTGCLLLPTALILRFEFDFPWRLEGVYQTLMAALHLLMGLAVCSFLGALWSIHMRQGWRKKQNRISGVCLTSAWILLALTGVGLYYLGNDQAQWIVSITHVSLGLAIFGVYVWHIAGYWKQPSL